MSTRKYNAISSFEMKGSNRDHSGQSIDEYHKIDTCVRTKAKYRKRCVIKNSVAEKKLSDSPFY